MDATVSPVPTTPATTASASALAAPLGASHPPAMPIGAGLLLAALAGATLVVARRRRRVPHLVEVVETASLGPKRSLVVARMGDELLLLGASEGGIALLATRPATGAPGPAATPAANDDAPPPAAVRGGSARLRDSAVHGLLARLRLAGAPPAPGFDHLLAESAEGVELRRKLAAGEPGRVR